MAKFKKFIPIIGPLDPFAEENKKWSECYLLTVNKLLDFENRYLYSANLLPNRVCTLQDINMMKIFSKTGKQHIELQPAYFSDIELCKALTHLYLETLYYTADKDSHDLRDVRIAMNLKHSELLQNYPLDKIVTILGQMTSEVKTILDIMCQKTPSN